MTIESLLELIFLVSLFLSSVFVPRDFSGYAFRQSSASSSAHVLCSKCWEREDFGRTLKPGNANVRSKRHTVSATSWQENMPTKF